MADLSISNVVNISVAEAGTGIGEYNTSNVAIFTREAAGGGFGTDGYKLYKSPTDVGVDFGTGSSTYSMAVALFSQKPNILANGGYLVVMPYADEAGTVEIQQIDFSAVPVSGTYKLAYGVIQTTDLAHDADADTVQTALRLLSGLSSITVTGDYTAGFEITFIGIDGDATLLAVADNSLLDSGALTVDLTFSVTTAGVPSVLETMEEALIRTVGLVQYFGIMTSEIPSEADMLDAAAWIETQDKMGFFVSTTVADVEVGGMLDLLRSGGFTHSRGLLYTISTAEALKMMAAYVGRGLSVNFGGSNTTMTMHLKDLQTIQPDSGMTETLLAKCQAAGVDVYCSIQGVAKVFCSGLNDFFDNVYNLLWFVGALKVAGFNTLAQTSTKIVQTENGVSTLKSAYRKVCEQAVTNQYAAAGTWTRPETFGSQEDMFANIEQRGYYIYSIPVSQQSAADRAARKAPLIQIAIKMSGAIHSSDVLVAVNA